MLIRRFSLARQRTAPPPAPANTQRSTLTRYPDFIRIDAQLNTWIKTTAILDVAGAVSGDSPGINWT